MHLKDVELCLQFRVSLKKMTFFVSKLIGFMKNEVGNTLQNKH